MGYKHIAAALLLSALVMTAAFAATGDITPRNADKITSAINGGSEGLNYVYNTLTNRITLSYRISDFNVTQYNYYVRVYSNQHSAILYEVPLTAAADSRSVQLNRIPDGTYWLNLQRWVKGDEDAYCQRVGYPCEIGKNLDMIRLDIGSGQLIQQGDEYQAFISGAISRSGQPVKGAAWTNR